MFSAIAIHGRATFTSDNNHTISTRCFKEGETLCNSFSIRTHANKIQGIFIHLLEPLWIYLKTSTSFFVGDEQSVKHIAQ